MENVDVTASEGMGRASRLFRFLTRFTPHLPLIMMMDDRSREDEVEACGAASSWSSE